MLAFIFVIFVGSNAYSDNIYLKTKDIDVFCEQKNCSSYKKNSFKKMINDFIAVSYSNMFSGAWGTSSRSGNDAIRNCENENYGNKCVLVISSGKVVNERFKKSISRILPRSALSSDNKRICENAITDDGYKFHNLNSSVGEWVETAWAQGLSLYDCQILTNRTPDNELRLEEENRIAEEKRVAEEERLEQQKKLAELALIEEEKKQAEEKRMAEEKRIFEEKRIQEENARAIAEEQRIQKVKMAKVISRCKSYGIDVEDVAYAQCLMQVTIEEERSAQEKLQNEIRLAEMELRLAELESKSVKVNLEKERISKAENELQKKIEQEMWINQILKESQAAQKKQRSNEFWYNLLASDPVQPGESLMGLMGEVYSTGRPSKKSNSYSHSQTQCRYELSYIVCDTYE